MSKFTATESFKGAREFMSENGNRVGFVTYDVDASWGDDITAVNADFFSDEGLFMETVEMGRYNSTDEATIVKAKGQAKVLVKDVAERNYVPYASTKILSVLDNTSKVTTLAVKVAQIVNWIDGNRPDSQDYIQIYEDGPDTLFARLNDDSSDYDISKNLLRVIGWSTAVRALQRLSEVEI